MKIVDRILDKLGYTKSTTWGKLWKTAQENRLFGNKVQDPFKQVPNVYKSVKAIADNVPQAKLRFYDKYEEEVEDNDLIRLFQRPNPLMSYGDFIQAVVGFYALFGETKIIKAESIAGNQRRLTTGLYPVKPSMLEPVFNQGRFPPELQHWQSGQTVFRPEDVIFARDFNPNNYFKGIAPTEPLSKVIDIDWKGLCFNSAFFENSATLGLALSTDKSLSNEQRKRLEEWVKQHYKGHTKAFRTIVLEAGLEAKPIGSTHKDMDFIEQMKYTREETLGVWRVPKALFNITDDLNYATFVGQMKVFWLYGLMPILRKLEDVLNKDLVQPYRKDLHCKFDIRNVPAFKEDFKDKVENAQKLFQMGIPLNEILQKLDLGFDEVDGGDVGYIPFSLMPIGSAGKVEEEKAIENKGAEDKTAKLDDLVWKSFLNRHSVLENRFKSALSRFFFEQRRRVLEQVNKKSAETINIDINWESENEELQKIAKPHLLGGIMAGVDFGKEILQQEVEEQILQVKMRSLLANGTRTITRINDTVREQTEKELAEAIKNGETVQQASDRIRGVYNNASSRTKTIARTEMTNVMNGGNNLYAEEAGAELKRWVTAGDERVRPRHRALNGVTIGIKNSFSNGLMYPGEKGGLASDVINCRCVLVYTLKEGE